ncbi:MAG: signal recognition particle receptor subunit alpha [Deltaproteobacteria bacterium]|nr:signal recognition particle receptor subunit alpha [Deltaproteobacteria bacterium]MCL5277325.1 signal recognition particle receptor subunit alpha [Deltaproteobacteria bacterium]
MLEFIQEKITKLFDRLSKRGVLSESDIDAVLKEIRIVLLEADVHYRVAKELIDNVRQKAMGEGLSRSIDPSRYLLGILKTEMINILGPAASVRIDTTGDVVMLVGLQGTGKTTTAVKLARHMKEKRGLKPYLVSLDFTRPAAQEQLAALAKANGFAMDEGTSDRGHEGLKDLRLSSARRGCDFIVVDTAGRLHVDGELMDELRRTKDALRPSATILVIDSMMGHDVLKVAESFMSGVGYDGAIFTKFEGDSRGGAVISFRKTMGRPIFFVGTGEAVSAIEPFDPERLVARVIGSGDMAGLVEKLSEAVAGDGMEQAKRIAKGRFTFQDFIKQMRMIKRLGSVESLFGMLPGASRLKGIARSEDVRSDLKRYEAIINSMTNRERDDPDILNGRRKQRIAKGSGTRVEDVNRLIKRFYETQRMMDIIKKTGIKGIQKYIQ